MGKDINRRDPGNIRIAFAPRGAKIRKKNVETLKKVPLEKVQIMFAQKCKLATYS